jgi:hypothetical protein
MPKLLKLQPAAVGAALAAVYAAAVTIYRALSGEGVLEPDLIVAAVTAVWGLWTRTQVTPLARPRDADGERLTPYGT